MLPGIVLNRVFHILILIFSPFIFPFSVVSPLEVSPGFVFLLEALLCSKSCISNFILDIFSLGILLP